MKQRTIWWSILSLVLLVSMGCTGKQPNVKIIGLDTPIDTASPEQPQTDKDEIPAQPPIATSTPDKVLVTGFPTESKLTIDVFIMSQCPYGVQMIPALREVLDQFNGEVKVNVNYIGQETHGEFSSMHGDAEVQGNIDQLCARKIAPTETAYWDFLECVNENWREIPSQGESCAEQVQLNKSLFQECRHGDEGKNLLSLSFGKAKEKSATGSPTIFVNGTRYSGNRGSSAIAQFICGVHEQGKEFETCKTLPAPPEVELFAITDSRCGTNCDVTKMMKSLKGIFMNLKPTVLDWSQPEAKEIMKAAKLETLPALLLTESVKKDEDGFKHMERWLTKTGPYYQVKVKATFDPTAEICDNNIDDTNNGKVDCADKTCKETLACRKKRPRTLELFVMSQCPFGAMAVLAMEEVLAAFKNEINFKIHFIGTNSNNKISSMHGQEEVDENMRWLCAKQHYPKQYLNYIWCRAGDYRNPDWQKCATGKIKEKVIQRCMERGEGEALLRADIEIANELNFGASPSWIANGRHKFSGVTASAIQKAYCEENPTLSGCQKELSNERKTDAPSGACGH